MIPDVAQPHSIFASLLREQFQPAISKCMEAMPVTTLAQSEFTDGRADNIVAFTFLIYVSGVPF